MITMVDRVISCYEYLTDGVGGAVRLYAIRQLLGDLGYSTEMDEALRALVGNGFSIEPEANQRTLTAKDHAAACWFGGEASHLIVAV